MENQKFGFGKKFSRFLCKFFWHLNQQPVPIYSLTNQKSVTPLPSSKKSTKKHKSKSPDQYSLADRNYIRSQYPARYRTCSQRNRTTTLTSIQEE